MHILPRNLRSHKVLGYPGGIDVPTGSYVGSRPAMWQFVESGALDTWGMVRAVPGSMQSSRGAETSGSHALITPNTVITPNSLVPSPL